MDVRRASVRLAPWLSAAIVVSWATLSAKTDSVDVAGPGEYETLYVPSQDDFRAAYELDRANQRLQAWNDYWAWITSFYNGTILTSGWSRQAPAIVGLVKSERKQSELIKLVNDLGKKISMEWAKDVRVSRISTSDLLRWNGVLMNAKRAETGQGDHLEAAVLEIRAEVARKLRLEASPHGSSGNRLEPTTPGAAPGQSENRLVASTRVTSTTMDARGTGSNGTENRQKRSFPPSRKKREPDPTSPSS